LATVPIKVVAVSVALFGGQLALWYQVWTLHLGEETVIALRLNGEGATSWRVVSLRLTDSVVVNGGTVRVQSKRDRRLEAWRRLLSPRTSRVRLSGMRCGK
jgi:hypothetical protein